ncbi:MAG: hypothetical protein IJ789_03155 [Bacteroidales bacterium]|nr:hypothetical protein [Bacteroidales bacterium]
MKLNKTTSIVLAILVAVVLQLMPTACTNEPVYLQDSGLKLQFDCDTLTFDTVFTTMGSTTRRFKVYNPHHDDVLITSVTLKKGRSSRFRLNVDGDTSLVARNVELAAGDSIFIFVHANIDPNDQLSPFVVDDDAVEFTYKGGSSQSLPLLAWGRNAVYHLPDSVGRAYALDCATWDHQRPHVIFGIACVDSLQVLNLQAGDELYFAPESYLMVIDGASLVAQGSADQPVVFSSLRHDGWYDYLPGQWGYIHLMAGSRDNVMDHVLVENSTIGIVADTNVNFSPTLRISNAEVRHCSDGGLLGRGAWIEGTNVLIHTCGTATLALQMGGRYTFAQSTFANYWRYASRNCEGVILNNWYLSAEGNVVPRNLTEATFTDCIIYGSYDRTEVRLDDCGLSDFNYRFVHSIVKGGSWNDDPLFVDPDEEDFHLQDGSPAAGIGYQFND